MSNVKEWLESVAIKNNARPEPRPTLPEEVTVSIIGHVTCRVTKDGYVMHTVGGRTNLSTPANEDFGGYGTVIDAYQAILTHRRQQQ